MKRIIKEILLLEPKFWVKILFKDIWILRDEIRAKRLSDKPTPRSCIGKGWKLALYNEYWRSFGGFVGIGAEFDDKPVFPHGPLGVFISNSAHIGKKCVIFQQVTIGSNMLKDSSHQGSPYIEDNVYIGCGAKIIGSVHVGHNARIGANCVIVKDVSPNTVTVIRGIESIQKDYELDNEYIPNSPHYNG